MTALILDLENNIIVIIIAVGEKKKRQLIEISS